MRPWLALAWAMAAWVPHAAAADASTPAGRHAGLACRECHPDGGADYLPCSSCHEAATNVHPSGVTPSFPIPSEFPLKNGQLDCPSCHRLHGPTGPQSLRGFDGRPADSLKEFCVQCHGSSLTTRDPHRASGGTDRCSFCHATIDAKAILAGSRPNVKAAAERLCDSCHDMRARNHPRNIDPVLDLPPGLPRGPGGTITCITCHDAHGSSRFTHYVREAYAKHFERGREENPHVDDRRACGSCHVLRAPEQITRESHELRFQGDAILLCISCHVQARSHHPVGTPLPPEMARRLAGHGSLPLDSNGRTTCTTCHTNNCESNEQRMSIRHYDPNQMNLALCWMCHAQEEFASTDPHRKTTEDEKDGCAFCHDRPPIKGLERAEDLYFVSQVKMICLRCHTKPSAQDLSHIRKTPTPEILERLAKLGKERALEFPLARDGKFTCTTCHNAHFATGKQMHRTRLPTRQMCALCHER